MADSNHILSHPSLNCKLRGISPSDSTIQYRNLKFASIPGRWKDSELLDKLPSPSGGVYDATKWGPSCPQKIGAQEFDVGLVGNARLALGEGQGKDEVMDEFECLHAVVTVPKGIKQGDEKGLPVFVWVHGGALGMGSNSWPQYEVEKFVARSIEIGKPVIGVGINYRVNIFGFLASDELGSKGNYGYKDQIQGFRWIKKHIAGFGGDPENVTAVGESAGAISLSTLLVAVKEPLFTRAILMSGDATLRKPRRMRWHNSMYQDNLKLLGLDNASPEERTKILKTMPAEELALKLPIAQHFAAVVDGDFLEADVDLGTLSTASVEAGKPDWCKELVVGDTLHDGSVLRARIMDDPTAFDRLHALTQEYLSPSERETFLKAYDLTEKRDDKQVWNGLCTLTSDARFHFPQLKAAEGWKAKNKTCHRYQFHQANPVPGIYEGFASHELDVAYLFQQFNNQFPRGSVELAKRMADIWIDFTNGNGWPHEGDKSIVVLGEDKITLVSEAEYDRGYRNGRDELMEKVGWKKLFALIERLQNVKPDEVTFPSKL